VTDHPSRWSVLTPAIGVPQGVYPQGDEVGHDDVLVLPYSSGTTGLPKGVELTNGNLLSNLLQCSKVEHLEHGSTCVAVLPFYHIYPLQLLLSLVPYVGAKIVTMERFHLPTYLQMLSSHRVIRAQVAPPIAVALAKHPMVAEYDLSSLKYLFSGAAPLSASTCDAVEARFPGLRAKQAYGASELSPAATITPDEDIRPGSVGPPVPGTQLCVMPVGGENADTLDPERDALPAGESGEIWVQGPQRMKGYLNNPEATRKTIHHSGFLMTGDIGYLDEDGYLYIVDRVKELIKVKGHQVPPAELEGVLLKHPGVSDCAVVGVPDEEAGERVKAYVVLGEGYSDEDLENIRTNVNGHLANFKKITYIEAIEAIPKSAAGKILRRLLAKS